MKTIVMLCLTLMLSVIVKAQTAGTTGAQSTSTGATQAITGTQTTTNLEDLKAMKAMLEKIQSDLKKGGITPQEDKTENNVLSPSQKCLILLPISLFFLCLLITFFFAKKNNDFDFRKAFYSEDAQQITKIDPLNPQITLTTTLLVDGMPVYKLSVSRIIAFLSSLTTLSVIVCIISYYAYCMLKQQTLPDFKNLFEVIVGLGLGIVPYGFNKLTSTSK